MTDTVETHPWFIAANEGATAEMISAYEAWEAGADDTAVCIETGWWRHWVDTRRAFFDGWRAALQSNPPVP